MSNSFVPSGSDRINHWYRVGYDAAKQFARRDEPVVRETLERVVEQFGTMSDHALDQALHLAVRDEPTTVWFAKVVHDDITARDFWEYVGVDPDVVENDPDDGFHDAAFVNGFVDWVLERTSRRGLIR